jgi:hypothetical protein
MRVANLKREKSITANLRSASALEARSNFQSRGPRCSHGHLIKCRAPAASAETVCAPADVLLALFLEPGGAQECFLSHRPAPQLPAETGSDPIFPRHLARATSPPGANRHALRLRCLRCSGCVTPPKLLSEKLVWPWRVLVRCRGSHVCHRRCRCRCQLLCLKRFAGAKMTPRGFRSRRVERYRMVTVTRQFRRPQSMLRMELLAVDRA